MGDDALYLLLSSMESMNSTLNQVNNIVATENLNRDNRNWQSNEAKKARDFSAAQAELAYQRQTDYFEQYLSPAARLRQWSEAGINPVLAVDGASATSAPSAPQASTVGASAPYTSVPQFGQVFSILDKIMSIKQMQANIRQTDAETNKITKETSWIDTYNTTSVESLKAGIEQVKSNIDVNEQQVQESLQRVQESLKRMDKMDSEIEVNGALVDLHGSQQVLNESRAAVEKMNAKQIEMLLPYIQSRQEAEIAFTNAKSQEAKMSAEALMYDANLKMLKGLVDAKLIDSSYYDSVIDQAHWDVKYKKREYKWKPINDICHNVSMLAIGAGSLMNGGGSIINSTKNVTDGIKEVATMNYF